MNHEAIQDQLFALYDGELDEAARKAVEEHMAGCLACREVYERWAKTAKLIFQPQKPRTSEFFVKRVMDRIHAMEEPARANEWGLSLRWLVPAIGVALMFLAVIPPPSQALSLDALLYQDSNGRSSWLFSNKALTADDTLQFVMEDQQ